MIPYSLLQGALAINNIRELENLLIECVYEGVIKGKLDQEGKTILVEWALARDLQEGEINGMIDTLMLWETQTSSLLSTVEQQKNFVRAEHQAILSLTEQTERTLQRVQLELRDRKAPQSSKQKVPR